MAARKARSLVQCGAIVTVVATDVGKEMASLEPSLHAIERRPYESGDASGYRLVVTATGDSAVDGAVYDDAESSGVWSTAPTISSTRRSFFPPSTAMAR